MQKQWSFYDAFGRLYIIGFFHSPDTGNFVLYVNNNISIIDFNITENKDYSFIIGSRLLKLSIEKASRGYEYQLKDNTPHPKQERWEVIRDKIAAVLMVGALLGGTGFLIMLFTGMIHFQ